GLDPSSIPHRRSSAHRWLFARGRPGSRDVAMRRRQRLFRSLCSLDLGKTTSITGRLNFHEAHGGPDGSIARIAFSDSKLDDGDCRCNGLFVKGFQDPDRVGFYMLVDGEPELISSRKFETPITFKFSIDSKGVMTLQVGKEEVHAKSAKLPHPQRDTMVMSCSGADVSFLNVDPQ
ncbi:MAG TPA: hypothetical protein VM053_01000, partial [Gemmatimonadaceae bacterium]|nr:hypothetical protein [Gemmatimonadaceae bacterium]